jgi:hypothetical protein
MTVSRFNPIAFDYMNGPARDDPNREEVEPCDIFLVLDLDQTGQVLIVEYALSLPSIRPISPLHLINCHQGGCISRCFVRWYFSTFGVFDYFRFMVIIVVLCYSFYSIFFVLFLFFLLLFFLLPFFLLFFLLPFFLFLFFLFLFFLFLFFLFLFFLFYPF